MNETGGGVVGKSTVDPKGVGVSFAGAIADVEIDPETGKVTVLRFTCVQDVGKAVHPVLRGRPDAGRQRPGHRLGPQ